MSRLTDAFDQWLEILRQCYVSTGEHQPSDIYALPGATDELLDQVETEIGHTLAPEVRELFGHANGVEVRGMEYSFGPNETGFRPVQNNIMFKDSMIELYDIVSMDWPVDSPMFVDGIPHQPFPVFHSFFNTSSVLVECSERYTGAVSHIHLQDGDFSWVSRSLTTYLERQVEAFNAGAITWHKERHKFNLDHTVTGYIVGGRQAGDYPEGKDQESIPGFWRWDI